MNSTGSILLHPDAGEAENQDDVHHERDEDARAPHDAGEGLARGEVDVDQVLEEAAGLLGLDRGGRWAWGGGTSLMADLQMGACYNESASGGLTPASPGLSGRHLSGAHRAH